VATLSGSRAFHEADEQTNKQNKYTHNNALYIRYAWKWNWL